MTDGEHGVSRDGREDAPDGKKRPRPASTADGQRGGTAAGEHDGGPSRKMDGHPASTKDGKRRVTSTMDRMGRAIEGEGNRWRAAMASAAPRASNPALFTYVRLQPRVPAPAPPPSTAPYTSRYPFWDTRHIHPITRSPSHQLVSHGAPGISSKSPAR
ncbi:hypothetical protein BJ912DRAFT_1069894 [Pholiota molesta]|nr:hypothetical protein BJ912DRAFT_1069894 [Pholiota molesta]